MVDDAFKKAIFEKKDDGGYGIFLIDILNVLERVERHIDAIKIDNKALISEVEKIKERERDNSFLFQNLSKKSDDIEIIAKNSLKASMVAIFALILIGAQTSPEFIGKLINKFIP